jgi:hypothetical protein
MQDNPGCIWLLGLFFMFIGGLFVTGALGLFTNADTLAWYERLLVAAMGTIALGAGLVLIYRAPRSRISVNRELRMMELERRGVFVNERRKISFEETDAVELQESTDGDGDPIFRPALKLKNGERVSLFFVWSNRAETEKQIRTIEKWLR